MIVVGDAGPLLYLGAIGRIDLLRLVFGTVVIPPEVRREVVDDGAGQLGSAELEAAIESGWVRVLAATTPAASLAMLAVLDKGEAAALTLAIEIRADLLLADDRKARTAAVSAGLKVKGTLGVLLSAKAGGHVGTVSPLIAALQAAGLYLDEVVIREVLGVAGEG